MSEKSIISKSKSALVAKKIYIDNMRFQRNENNSNLLKFTKSSVEKSINQIGDNIFRCSLSVNMTDDKDEAEIEVTVVGIFEISKELIEETKEVIIAKNTIAILFPYMRSQITLLTSQPEVLPVVLPPININALLENIQKSKTL